MTPDQFQGWAKLCPEAMLLVRRDGEILAANTHVRDLGFAPEDLPGRSLFHISNNGEESLAEFLRLAARSREPLPGKLVLRSTDGNLCPCRCEGLLDDYDPGGGKSTLLIKLTSQRESVIQFTALNQKVDALNREVHRRRQLEEELRKQNEYLQVTLTSIGDGVIVTDAEGCVTMLNKVAERLTGWDTADAAGEPLVKVFHIVNESTRLPVENPALRALRDGVIVGLANHTVLIAKDGSERPIDDSAAPIIGAEGRLLGAVLVFRDISERRFAETKLKQTQAEFHHLANAIPQLCWMAEPDGDITWYNDRWYEYTGTTPEHMLGWGWQCVHDPATLPEVLKRWQASLATGEPFDMVFPLRGADGSYRSFLTRVMPFHDAEGNIVRWFGTNTDISEQRELQEELRQVAARLSESHRRKDEFLATLAHELRNPLAPISTGLEILKILQNDPEERELIRDTMERQVKQLVTLIDDLMDVSRITRGKLQLRKQRIAVREAVQIAIESAQPLIQQKQHDFTVSLLEQPLFVYADPNRLAQVISNLLHNAAKYTPPNGRIWLAVHRENGEVIISVKDTGAGIPHDNREDIFEMFKQIDRPLERAQAGLGIGLTLVKSLVTMHKGSIEVRSAGSDQGSEFLIRLPVLNDSESSPVAQPRLAPVRPRSAFRILVVDDNRPAAESLKIFLSLYGHDVQSAHDGMEGLTYAKEFRPQVILLDLGMPKLNGYETAKRIRAEDWGQETVLIAVTGWGQEEDRQKTREAGFDYHLVKPIDPEALQIILAELEDRSTAGPSSPK